MKYHYFWNIYKNVQLASSTQKQLSTDTLVISVLINTSYLELFLKMSSFANISQIVTN